MNKEVAWARGKDGEAFLLNEKASAESALGKLKLAQVTLAEARDSARRNGMGGYAALSKATESALLANYGDCVDAKVMAAASAAEVPEGPSRIASARTLALCGDAAAAQKIMEAEAKAHPLDTGVHGVAVPLVQAANSLHRGDATSAIAALEPAHRFESASGPGNAPYWVLYMRGRAYLRLNDPDKAVAEFQKILDFRGRFPESELIPLAQLQLARAYALQKDAAKSKVAYQDFLALWKDADPDVPILKEAKAEYAKLQ